MNSKMLKKSSVFLVYRALQAIEKKLEYEKNTVHKQDFLLKVRLPGDHLIKEQSFGAIMELLEIVSCLGNLAKWVVNVEAQQDKCETVRETGESAVDLANCLETELVLCNKEPFFPLLKD